jgi:glycosyltransferase involved in cell wall biosynthesis
MRILQVFNRYVHMGGEEKSVDRIYRHLSERHEMGRCFFESKDWLDEGAPGKFGQLRRTFYNHESRARFEKAVEKFQPDAALFHNVYPVGSPSLYHAAHTLGLPVIQYMHNFRPFSISGTLYANGVFPEEALRGDYSREVRAGVWQGSRLKSAIMAMVLRRLHRSGWLQSVKAWVCISEFLRDKLVHGAGLPADRVFALRHSWDAMPDPVQTDDKGYYLFLARLVDVKGVTTLLRTWDILREKLGAATPELWIGGEGPLEDEVRLAVARHKDIHHLGLIGGAQKTEVLRHCRAMLAPSLWWEPLGLVTYEAYDYAKPMLAAASGGLTETVLHGKTGFLHEPGNAAALAQDVLKLEALSAEERRAMGAAGRKWLLENTSVEQWQNQFDEVLRRVKSGAGK